ncbi:MAG: helix-turn-helix domain-containing protein [Actinophytocola sp.]|nr:helix-turn-helix domain-containing protein [Actinophytocola sp.]
MDAEKGQIPDRALYRVSEAEQLLSLSRSAIYEDIRAGRLQSVRRGRSRLIPAAAIQEYVQLLINESEDAHEQAA